MKVPLRAAGFIILGSLEIRGCPGPRPDSEGSSLPRTLRPRRARHRIGIYYYPRVAAVSPTQPSASRTEHARRGVAALVRKLSLFLRSIVRGPQMPAASSRMTRSDGDKSSQSSLHQFRLGESTNRSSQAHHTRRGTQRKISVTGVRNRGQWTLEEDIVLKKLVEKHGLQKWSVVARGLKGRIGKQCRERYHNHLREDLHRGEWSQAEERRLVEAHIVVGNKWAEIARILRRAENGVKNHWVRRVTFVRA